MRSSEPVSLAGLLKKGATVSDVYDLVYSLEYLKPSFELGLNGKPLRQLSPGERGIMLLVFYLVVDLSDEPLIIDQPEGNLNNQSLLITWFRDHRGEESTPDHHRHSQSEHCCRLRRGTIIHCEMSGWLAQYPIQYGSSKPNSTSCRSTLEGTRAALDARVVTYHRPTARTGVWSSGHGLDCLELAAQDVLPFGAVFPPSDCFSQSRCGKRIRCSCAALRRARFRSSCVCGATFAGDWAMSRRMIGRRMTTRLSGSGCSLVRVGEGRALWIITEADRSSTTSAARRVLGAQTR
jgi:hypothetical protein